MVIDLSLLDAWLGQFLLPMLRILGVLISAPLFSQGFIPMPIRALLVVALTVALSPLLPLPDGIELFSTIGLMMGARELLIGLAMGFFLQLVFDAVVVGMQTVAMSMGLGFAVMVDNQRGAQVPVLGQFYLLFSMLLFLSFDGHLLMVQFLFESFEVLPVDGRGLLPSFFLGIAEGGSMMFFGALRVALPAATAVLLVNIAFGVISRAAPTLNLFAVGLPFTMLVGFIVLASTFSSHQYSLQWLIAEALFGLRGVMLME